MENAHFSCEERLLDGFGPLWAVFGFEMVLGGGSGPQICFLDVRGHVRCHGTRGWDRIGQVVGGARTVWQLEFFKFLGFLFEFCYFAEFIFFDFVCLPVPVSRQAFWHF